MFANLKNQLNWINIWKYAFEKLIVKDDEYYLNDLLKEEKDKVLFHNTIIKMQRENIKSKTIVLNNKKVEITI